MNQRERKVFLETKLRNLRRLYSKMKEHSDLTEDSLKIQAEIEWFEDELKTL